MRLERIQVTKEAIIYGLIGLAYALLVLGLLIVAIWTLDWRYAATAVLLALPSVLIIALGKKAPNE